MNIKTNKLTFETTKKTHCGTLVHRRLNCWPLTWTTMSQTLMSYCCCYRWNRTGKMKMKNAFSFFSYPWSCSCFPSCLHCENFWGLLSLGLGRGMRLRNHRCLLLQTMSLSHDQRFPRFLHDPSIDIVVSPEHSEPITTNGTATQVGSLNLKNS